MFPSALIILRIIITLCLIHVCAFIKAQTRIAGNLIATEPVATLLLRQFPKRSTIPEELFQREETFHTNTTFGSEEDILNEHSSFSGEPERVSADNKRMAGPVTTRSIKTFEITKCWKAEKSNGVSITQTLSGFVTMGFPGKNVYPKCRAGFSISSSIAKRFEVEAGMRYLSFGSSSQVYTGYFGKFYRNFLFGVRTFVTPANRGTSHSYSFISRYYIKGSVNFLSLCLGSGIASDDRTLNIQFINKKRIDSRLAAAGYSHNLSKTNVVSFNAAWVNQDYRSAFLTQQIDISAGFKRLF